MNENEEIKKDLEALKDYLKNGNPNDLNKFTETFGNKYGISPAMIKKSIHDESHLKSTPARISFNKEQGIMQIPKSMFDKKNPEYHRMKIRIFTKMTILEVMHIEQNIKHKIHVTNKRIREWYDYTEKELNQYNESMQFLKELNLGEEINRDYLAIGIVSKLKYDLIKKFWWRLGVFGIKKRFKMIKQDLFIKKLRNKHNIKKHDY